jgi:hypothetical protein
MKLYTKRILVFLKSEQLVKIVATWIVADTPEDGHATRGIRYDVALVRLFLDLADATGGRKTHEDFE